jgi:IS5 family transposase
VAILTDQCPDLAAVDRGYRGHDEGKTRIRIIGARRGLTAKEIIDLRRRSAIKAEIGHMKTDGRLSRRPLKGTIGDAILAVLNACGTTSVRSWTTSGLGLPGLSSCYRPPKSRRTSTI